MGMRFFSLTVTVVAGVVLATVLAGCPKAPDTSLALLVTPKSLDFGATETTLPLIVSKNYTSAPLGQFQASSSVPWLTVSPSSGTSSGPEDPATLLVSVHRERMNAGENLGNIILAAQGASQVSVPVKAFCRVGAAFSVGNNNPFVGDEVRFTDQSQAVGGAPPISSWAWNFGDGGTSNAQSPTHVYTAEGSYSITLTVSNGDESAVLTRQNFVTVRARIAPVADFQADSVEVYPGESVQFNSTSNEGTGAVINYAWNFGDGGVGSGRNPVHSYTDVGTYSVSLAVTTAHGQDARTRQNYITVLPYAPQAAFRSDLRQTVLGISGGRVAFSDESEPGSFPIADWFWEFGDGETSGEPEPVHAYEQTGFYTVSLTVTAANGQMDTFTALNYIEVIPNDIAAEFALENRNVEVEQDVQFTDLSAPGPSPIIQWRWDFGDGESSFEQHPRHVYGNAGTFTVSLTVTNAHGFDEEVKADCITVWPISTVKRYIRDSGPATYTVHSVLPVPYAGKLLTAHILDLHSQTFRPGEVEPAEWHHWMVVITPSQLVTDTALLIISGGSNRATPNFDPDNVTGERAVALEFVAQTGAAAILLPTVPNQPLVFHGDGIGRREDDAIAYTFDQFLNGGDEYWPLLLPMARSAAAAMDVTQDYGAANGFEIQDFVITGASKRGWTTWLTGAADERVRAIAPLVIDVANMRSQMNYHRQAYDGYSYAVQDYVDFDVFDRFGTERGQELLKIVDPYSYLWALDMPKLIVNSTGDQFFLPDSAQFYVHELPGETRIRYMPNTNHGIEQGSSLVDLGESLISFFHYVANDYPLPSFSWEVIRDNEIRVQTQRAFAPVNVQLWSATVSGPLRDFRLASTGAIWSSQTLQDPDGDGIYIATVPAPTAPNTWTGFFAALTFHDRGQVQTFCTELRVTPDVMPFGPPVVRVDKNATGAGDGSSWSNAFTSIQEAIVAATGAGLHEIWVAEGVYEEAILLESDLALYGGFKGTEHALFDRDFNAHPVIIDGRRAAGGLPAKHVVTIEQKSNIRLDGFSITGGDASVVIPGDWSATAGGGIYCSQLDETVVIANCKIYGNRAANSGGGIACTGFRDGSHLVECSPVIENCLVTDNYGALGAGGILCFARANPTIVNTVVADNRSTGIENEWGGGGIGCVDASSPAIVNCILARNTTTAQTGGLSAGSLVWGGDCDPVCINTIFFENDDIAVFEGTTDSDVTLKHCLFFGNTAGDVWDENSTLYTGAALINAHVAGASLCVSGNPEFIDADNGDFRVKPSSPAVDAGTADGAPDAAADGTPRPQGSATDIGPYEQ
ncbi:MAG: PhoPQ-activated protein PqaA family protein [Candidatus Hydrogenedentales bacterium]|jgi:PhoPQ-activated pathogenicity-related protein/PKD repeat protein